MADNTFTAPEPAPEPPPAVDPPGASPASDPAAASPSAGFQPPPGLIDPTPDAAPEKGKPVVLATRDRLTRFVIPADLDDKGEPKGDPVVFDHHGLALSRKDADAHTDTAARAGVELIDITPAPSEKD